MKIKHLIVAFVIASGASLALAIEEPQWVGPTNIDFITVQPNGNVYVHLDVSTPDLGCTGNTDQYIQLDTSAPHFEAQFSLLMAAHMANRSVRIHVKHCGHFPYAQNSQVY